VITGTAIASSTPLMPKKKPCLQPQCELFTRDPALSNIEAIARLERDALNSRSLVVRVGDKVTGILGTMTAVLIHIAVIATWVMINVGFVPGVKPFDPYPFGLMCLLMSMEGVLVAMFVLITQNRMSRQADRRAHLNLQVNMLAEQEMTRVLQMLKLLCEKNGIEPPAEDDAVQMLLQTTNVEQLAQKLDEHLPG